MIVHFNHNKAFLIGETCDDDLSGHMGYPYSTKDLTPHSRVLSPDERHLACQDPLLTPLSSPNGCNPFGGKLQQIMLHCYFLSSQLSS